MDGQRKSIKGYANKDLFPQLSDDLLIIILSMLSLDLKFLCQCMLVSKRFAVLIPLISSGTLSIPRPQERDLSKLFKAQVMYAFKALKSFGKIRSLHLEFIEEEYKEFDFHWRAVFGSNTCTCACLVYDSITKFSAVSAGARVNNAICADSETIQAAIVQEPIFWRIVYPNLWRNLFAVFQPTVESIVMTDSKRLGKICIGNSELRDARACTSILDAWDNKFEEGRTSLKFFLVPELRLPKLGFVLEWAFLAICKMGGDSAEDDKYDDMLNSVFGEEHGVFAEALNLIVRTPELIESTLHLKTII